MQIAEKVKEFYLENEEAIWYGIVGIGIFAYGAWLGYNLGLIKGFDQGEKSMEIITAMMEPEAHDRMVKTATSIIKKFE